jgi:alkylated DNA repair dioxygenase AlkB
MSRDNTAVQLFETNRLPEGFQYRTDFISGDEQRMLVSAIERIEFSTFEMRGVVARRRVAFFGASYKSGDKPQGPIPEFLSDVRARAAEWAGIHPQDFAMALVNEYRAGAPIGWHRDAPQYGIIAGISLLSSCRMKLRPYVAPSTVRGAGKTAPRKTTHEITLEPRSGYLITGPARNDFEHSIPSTTALRYSITFRTLR